MSRKKPVRAAQSGSIELPAQLSIVHAAELHRTLVTRLGAGGPLVIDGSRVEEIDTAILQLLAGLWRSARERGLGCTCHNPSGTLRKTADLIGLAGVLDLRDASA